MSDFFENEIDNLESDESSSVFSKPAEHKQVKMKKKRLFPKIIAGVLALCVLAGGTFAVIKFIPEMEDEDANSSTGVEEIKVKELESDSISSVTLTNTHGSLELYSKTTKKDDTETVEWFLKTVDKDLIDESFITSVVDAVCNITSTRKITEKTAQECGLENPKIKAVVTPKKGSKYTVTVGDKSTDNMGYYAMVGNDIYVVSDEMQNTLNYSKIQFASLDNIPAFTDEDGEYSEYFANEQLAQFDRLTLKGDKHPEGLELILNDNEEISQYLGYLVNKPQKRIAENVEGIMTLYQSGVAVVGAYSYDKSSLSLAKYGLDTPDLETTIYIKDKTLTYKFALQKDGYYAAVCNESKLIHRVEAAALEGVIELSTEDYYAGWIFFTSIDDLKSFTAKLPDKEYTFNIKKNKVDEDSDQEQEDYTITIGDKKLQAQSFQNLYQYIISVHLRDFTVDDFSGENALVWELGLKNGKKTVIEFQKFSATRYQCVVDGNVVGKVNASAIDKAIKYTEKVAAGQNIGEIS